MRDRKRVCVSMHKFISTLFRLNSLFSPDWFELDYFLTSILTTINGYVFHPFRIPFISPCNVLRRKLNFHFSHNSSTAIREKISDGEKKKICWRHMQWSYGISSSISGNTIRNNSFYIVSQTISILFFLYC